MGIEDRQNAGISRSAIGETKLSITVIRKTHGDLVVSNYAIERYFGSEVECAQALAEIVEAVTNAPVTVDGD